MLLASNYILDHIKTPKIRNHALNFLGGPSHCALGKDVSLKTHCKFLQIKENTATKMCMNKYLFKYIKKMISAFWKERKKNANLRI